MKETVQYPRLRAETYLKEGTDISVTEKEVTGFFLHWHDYFEIEIVMDGEGIHCLNGKEYPLSRGSAYALGPNDFHSIRTDSSIVLRNITFRENMLSEEMLLRFAYSDKRLYRTFNEKEYEAAELAAALLVREIDERGQYGRQFLEYILHFFVDMDSQKPTAQQIKGINKALVYLELHFREALTLSEVAAEAGFHPTYFCEMFKRVMGETYNQKLNRLRLEYAAMLLGSGCSVSYACFESGFGSLSNFFTAFKKKYGKSPKEYANSRKKDMDK